MAQQAELEGKPVTNLGKALRRIRHLPHFYRFFSLARDQLALSPRISRLRDTSSAVR